MKLRVFLTIAATAIVAMTLFAQNSFNGRWLVEITNPDGEHRDTTFFLKQSGDTLTGAILQNYRMRDIADGK
jgi:hypothetical protein